MCLKTFRKSAKMVLRFVLFFICIFKANSQLCPGPCPFLPTPNFCPYPSQILPQPPPCQEVVVPIDSVISQPVYPGSPVVATTIIDNTVSNALANAIQLLIVSNLIENTMNAGICPSNIIPYYDNFVNACPYNAIEANPVELIPVNPVLCEGPIIEPILCEASYPGYIQEVVPIQQFAPTFCQGFPYPDFPGSPLSPVATEVLFPSSIPAQLTCNFGYMNSNVPCVSVNVEPTPFDGCGCGQIYNAGPFY